MSGKLGWTQRPRSSSPRTLCGSVTYHQPQVRPCSRYSRRAPLLPVVAARTLAASSETTALTSVLSEARQWRAVTLDQVIAPECYCMLSMQLCQSALLFSEQGGLLPARVYATAARASGRFVTHSLSTCSRNSPGDTPSGFRATIRVVQNWTDCH
jgi:hypothetical protein